MKGEFEGAKDMKALFKKILGSEVTIKDNLDATEETVFDVFIKKLDESRSKEDIIFDEGGLDLKSVTDPLWLVVESMMKMIYGVDASDIILWWLFERFDPETGKLLELMDEKTGKKYTLLTPRDLYAYIKHRFPTF
tara:strand:+ start:587 stop:994 length:408 start_codon:yes stop_codon:yes gene_type:complete